MPPPPVRTVTVTGHGESRAVPDAATIRISLHHRATGVAEAIAGADSAARQAAETARRHTAPQRIASRGLHVWPAHDREGRREDGFEARHELSIRCDSVTAAGKLVSAMAAEVGDRLQIDSFSLDVSDPAAAWTAAREAAYDDARAKAEHLASLSGARLLDVLTIVEGGASPGRMYAIEAAAGTEDFMSFEPGETAIGATVTVTWTVE